MSSLSFYHVQVYCTFPFLLFYLSIKIHEFCLRELISNFFANSVGCSVAVSEEIEVSLFHTTKAGCWLEDIAFVGVTLMYIPCSIYIITAVNIAL